MRQKRVLVEMVRTFGWGKVFAAAGFAMRHQLNLPDDVLWHPKPEEIEDWIARLPTKKLLRLRKIAACLIEEPATEAEIAEAMAAHTGAGEPSVPFMSNRKETTQ